MISSQQWHDGVRLAEVMNELGYAYDPLRCTWFAKNVTFLNARILNARISVWPFGITDRALCQLLAEAESMSQPVQGTPKP